MLTKLNLSITEEHYQSALSSLPNIDFRLTLNRPSGRFFYDPWEIKPNYAGTVWEQILSSLPFQTGEARLIVLKPGNCYLSHSDIDDRYHINLQGQYCFLANIETSEMFQTISDLHWYDFDASSKHSAVNFGSVDRIQLVVRKLLKENKLVNPVKVQIISPDNDDTARFVFDDTLSKWLNLSNKQGIISDFNHDGKSAFFNIEEDHLDALKVLVPPKFNLGFL